MDPNNPTVTVASLSSIVHTTLLAYDCVTEALITGDTTVGLKARFRVELLRLRLWGRTRGFGLLSSPPLPSSNNIVSAIPEVRRLAFDMLGKTLLVLDRHLQIRKKPPPVRQQTLSRFENGYFATPYARVLEAKCALDQRLADPVQRAKVVRQIRRVMDDKAPLPGPWVERTTVREFLTDLVTLNTGLERLLPADEADFLARGLAGEILASEPRLMVADENSFGVRNSLAAGMVRLRQLTELRIYDLGGSAKAPTSAAHEVEEDEAQGLAAHPPAMKALSTFEIPVSCLQGFTEPPLPDIETHDSTSSQGKVLDAPPVRSVYLYTPRDPHEQEGYVLVEWHSQLATTGSSHPPTSDQCVAQRRQHLVEILRETSVVDSEFRVLECRGYTLATGRLPNGDSHPVLGFVYRLPLLATAPITLHDILATAYNSQTPAVPDLGDRVRLAQRLALSLYQLHCAGWIHGSLSSHNILFFFDTERARYDVTEPYICGWQDVHPTQAMGDGGEVPDSFLQETSAIGLGDMAMYAHPDCVADGEAKRGNQKTHDTYGLGVILTEIAFWEPIVALAHPVYREMYLRAGPPISLTAWMPIGDVSLEAGGVMYLEKSTDIGRRTEAEFGRNAGN
ncbi:hypothetical protein ASPACDRAFT_43738 [Aspergillus aculeatus ATCC 16872]|uniref:Prion-inhibition and propagation HeLo domain-containing protein n=1 Tax=Aspergillus aculeatus (strain ATCC 16872 / CBS 172.66 / WB 5094) TaxID=690307 RepID=A0A1L9WS67_ASPA1|nr:uncharacterized protein ASPACDRAFT_43738 [Aspergillus aculeatus ATCC 16872]OJJ99079.1 hypothetical protein ASPACDRAFT_43738 [Aspergillus aculeatus ATCC 16872]